MNNINSGIISRQRFLMLAKELFRKSIHLCSAFVPVLLGWLYWPTIIALSVVLVIYIVCEILRYKGINVPVISQITVAAARKRDENRFVLGPVTLCIGILSVSILFPLENATIGIFALAFGDGLASLFGKTIGRIKVPFTGGKTVAGSITCFTAIFVSAFFVCGNCLGALILGLTGMILEAMPLKDWDNVLIPLSMSFLSMIVL